MDKCPPASPFRNMVAGSGIGSALLNPSGKAGHYRLWHGVSLSYGSSVIASINLERPGSALGALPGVLTGSRNGNAFSTAERATRVGASERQRRTRAGRRVGKEDVEGWRTGVWRDVADKGRQRPTIG
jgi:hypothetical protein